MKKEKKSCGHPEVWKFKIWPILRKIRPKSWKVFSNKFWSSDTCCRHNYWEVNQAMSARSARSEQAALKAYVNTQSHKTSHKSNEKSEKVELFNKWLLNLLCLDFTWDIGDNTLKASWFYCNILSLNYVVTTTPSYDT